MRKLQVQVIQTWGGYYNVHGKPEKIVLLAAKQGRQIKGVHHWGHRQQLSLLPSLSKFHSPPRPSSSELSRCWAFQSGWWRSGLCAGVLGWPAKAISKVLPPCHSQFEQQLDSRQRGVPPLCAVHNAFQLLPHIAFGDAPSELQWIILISIAQHCCLSFCFVFGNFGGFP